MSMVTQKDEIVVKEGKANSFNILLAKGGNLTVTNQRVVWQGRGGQPDVIKLDDIVSYGKCFTITIFSLLLPIPNAFYILTNSGRTYKYTVLGRETWIAAIAKAIQDIKK